MAGTLRGRGGPVLDECDLVGGVAVRQAPSHELRRRAPGELPEVAVEMGLVVVAAAQRDLAERGPGGRREQPLRALEAQDACKGLRREAGGPREARREVPATPAR